MIQPLRKTLIPLVVGLFCLTGFVTGAPAADAADSRPTETVLGSGIRTDAIGAVPDLPAWTIYLRPGVRFGERRTIGYWDMLVPLYFTDKSLLFFNPRVSFDDREGHEWNVGMGYRHLLADDRLMLGGNVFFDWRKSPSSNWYKQVGVGGEVLTEWVNGRINGYIALSDAERIDPYQEWYFGESSLEYSWAYSLEEPLSGLDYEIGFKVPYVSDYVETWVYGLGYTYWSDYVENVQGWGGRIEVIPADFVKFNYEYRQDRTNDGEHYGEVTFEIPFSIDNLIAGEDPFAGLGDFFKGSRPMKERLHEQVRRDVDIVVATEKINSSTYPNLMVPGNPAEFYDDVFYVAPGHVGSGTLSNPGSMAQAEASGAPTVFMLFGNYAGYTWDRSNVNLFGMTFQPALINSKMSLYPWVMPGPTIFTDTLRISASNVAIEGLTFNNRTAVSVNANGSGAISILRNYFNSRVQLRGYSSVAFLNNTLYDNMTGLPGRATGLYVYAGAGGPLDANVSDNLISVNGPNSRPINIEEYGSINATFTSNRIWAVDTSADTSSPHGINVTGTGVINAVFTGNTITSHSFFYGANGIFVNSPQDMHITALNNVLNVSCPADDEASGIFIWADNPSSALIFAEIHGNSGTITGNSLTLMLRLREYNPSGNSAVNWSGNSFVPGSGSWSIVGDPTRPGIEHTFQPGDTLVP
jgi:hypothetical protein